MALEHFRRPAAAILLGRRLADQGDCRRCAGSGPPASCCGVTPRSAWSSRNALNPSTSNPCTRCPRCATEISPVSSLTTTTTASVSSVNPIAARWRMPVLALSPFRCVSGNTQAAATISIPAQHHAAVVQRRIGKENGGQQLRGGLRADRHAGFDDTAEPDLALDGHQSAATLLGQRPGRLDQHIDHLAALFRTPKELAAADFRRAPAAIPVEK